MPASNLSDDQIIDEARKHATAHVRDSVLTAFARAVIEYVRIGAEMLKLHTAISAIRNAPEAKRARDDARAVRDQWWDSLTAEQQAEHKQRDANERRRVESALTVPLTADHVPKHSDRIESTP